MVKSTIHLNKKNFNIFLDLFLISFLLLSCSTAHIVVGDLAPDTTAKLIHEKAKIAQIIESEGKTYLFTIIKESSIFPEFDQQHLVLTDLNGKPVDSEKFDVPGLNRTTGESVGLFTGHVITTLISAVSGLPILAGGTDEVINCHFSEGHRYMAVTKGGFPSTDVLLYDLKKGALITTVAAQYEWKNKQKLERKRISGHTINGVIGFTEYALYVLSADPGFASMDYYLTKISLEDYHQVEFDILEDQQPAVGYGDIGMKFYLIDDHYFVIDDGHLKIFDLNVNKVVKSYDISPYKGASTILYADHNSVVVGMRPLSFQPPSLRNNQSDCCDVIELSLDSGEIKLLYTIDAENPTFITDCTGRFEDFGIVTENLKNTKDAIGFIDYKTNKVRKIWEAYNVHPGIFVRSESKIYYYFNNSSEELYRIDLTGLVKEIY